jgi:hypothetical protein
MRRCRQKWASKDRPLVFEDGFPYLLSECSYICGERRTLIFTPSRYFTQSSCYRTHRSRVLKEKCSILLGGWD